MNILVFIKQVPDAADLTFHPVTKTLIREGIKNTINAYDRRAISEAVRYRNENGGKVIVATMGPPQAREALQEALLMGADEAIHIQDVALAGSDTLITARVLAAAARKIGFDLIWCGQHSTDSETAQVPAELAELLGIGYAAAVRQISYAAASIQVVCETDEGTDTFELSFPAVLSSAERLIKPIKMKNADLSTAPVDRIRGFDLQDLGLSPAKVGLDASPTWIGEIYEDRIQRNPLIQESIEPALAARMILDVIGSTTKEEVVPTVPPTGTNSQPEFWCLLEFAENALRPVSLEILSFASLLANWMDGSVAAISIGRPLSESQLDELSAFGADKIYAERRAISEDQTVALLCREIENRKPHTLLIPATSRGKILAPRIAARLGLGLTGDCVGLEFDSDNRLVQIKPAFGGNVLAPVYSRTSPQFATVRAGALPTMTPRSASRLPVLFWDAPFVPQMTRLIERKVDAGKDALNLEEREIVIGVGMGIGQENIPSVFHLAELWNAGVGATRRVVDSGWMERQFQIGLTGRFIAPQIYVALGIAGRINHMIGIRKANRIVAVNNDRAADIFHSADFGYVTDSVSVLKELIRLSEK